MGALLLSMKTNKLPWHILEMPWFTLDMSTCQFVIIIIIIIIIIIKTYLGSIDYKMVLPTTEKQK